MDFKTTLATLTAAAVSFATLAQEQASEPQRLRLGADVRLRQEVWDDIPIPTETPNITRGGYCNTLRLRTRVFGAYDLTENAMLNVRLAHMFYETSAGPESFKWPDELSLDNLNIAFKDFAGEGSRLVLGRQDIMLGSGRLVFEGTPLDASRTTFFDGVFLHQPLGEPFSADLFAVYDKDEDPLAVGNEHRQLRGYSPSVDGRDEAGVGAFLNGTLLDGSLTGSLYYVWKHETAARKAEGTAVPNADIHTVGVLLRPKFSDAISGEFEYARQFDPADDDGIDATLAYAGLFLDIEECKIPSSANGSIALFPKTKIGIDCLYLSGDDSDTERNEAFNPIFSRYPFLSELMIYCYDTEGAGNWNNLIHPRATALAKMGGHSLSLSAGPVFADERNGAGGGRRRGDLYMAQWGFPLFKGKEGGFGRTDGHLRCEIFDPGDYYTSNSTAYYLRWEILVRF